MADGASLTPRTARQYDLFQASLEAIGKARPFLNYGYTITGRESYEDRQQQLCEELFRAADIQPESVVVDVGFGTGEQDLLLAQTHPFARLIGFNIAERQVAFASARVAAAGLDERISLRRGEAEVMPGLAPASVDRVLAIECAFYFDRPRFYRRAFEVLRPGGLAVLADIALSDRLSFLTSKPDLRRVGTRSANRVLWERDFLTKSVRSINAETRPGAQMTVSRILGTVASAPFSRAQRREWLKMAASSQVVALALATRLLHYDLIVLEKPIRA
jgi:cyclopropane fatty-acyl-phospholipid synthase-like methyltransferase